jgi:hypothetical protein
MNEFSLQVYGILGIRLTVTAVYFKTVNKNFVNPVCVNNEVPPSKVIQMNHECLLSK